MKKLLRLIPLLLLVIGLASLVFSTVTAAASSPAVCPKGIGSCPYPGRCHSYVDANKDGYCDLTARTASVSLPSGGASVSQPALQSGTQVVSQEAVAAAAGSPVATPRQYYFLPLAAISALLYATTYMMARRKIFSLMVHRRIWNIVLLVSALLSAGLGLVLTLQIDHGLDMSPPFDMTFLHVEGGVVMGVIAIFHIFWHWRYFAKVMQPAKV
jgi:hypothetical protein